MPIDQTDTRRDRTAVRDPQQCRGSLRPLATAALGWLLLAPLWTTCTWANPVLDAAKAPVELQQDANRSLDARRWRLDAAVFTEITPFTAPDIAIKLPAEQQEEGPQPPAANAARTLRRASVPGHRPAALYTTNKRHQAVICVCPQSHFALSTPIGCCIYWGYSVLPGWALACFAVGFVLAASYPQSYPQDPQTNCTR